MKSGNNTRARAKAHRPPTRPGMLRAMLDHTDTWLAFLDSEFNLVWVNDAYARGAQLDRSEILGKNHFDLFPDNENKLVFARVRDTGVSARLEEKQVTYADQPERRATHRTWTISPVSDGDSSSDGLIISLTVKSGSGRVQDLSKALVLAAQRERHRISEVLHEDLQQVLLTEKMILDSLCRQGAPELTPDLQATASELRRLTAKAIDITRSVAVELNPPHLRGEGLDAAVRWTAHQMEKRYGLRVRLHFTESFGGIPEDTRILLTQIIRELLYNVVKHAHTGDVSILGHRQSGRLVVRVIDAGVGFDADRVRRDGGFRENTGMYSIQERLRLFDGRFEITSIPGKGTCARIELPVG